MMSHTETMSAPTAPATEPPPARAWPTTGELAGMYILGAIIPIVGVGIAVYLAVAARADRVRRHAIGVGAVTIIAAGMYLAIALSATGSSATSDQHVQTDLTTLLNNNGALLNPATGAQCAHQTGSQYACQVTFADGSTQTASVTDDGHTIYEQGITFNNQ